MSLYFGFCFEFYPFYYKTKDSLNVKVMMHCLYFKDPKSIFMVPNYAPIARITKFRKSYK